jgi:hypothetical protein
MSVKFVSGSRSSSLVRTILTQATRLREEGLLAPDIFRSQVDRLVREELEPYGLELLMRELADGRTRFLVTEKSSGEVRDMFETSPHSVS